MTIDLSPSRRLVLKAGLAVGGGLVLDLHLPSDAKASDTADSAGSVFSPNAFIRIGRDGSVTFIMRNTEVGQGIYTSVAMLIAEELEVALDHVIVQAAPPNEALYKDPILGSQATGGSASIRGSWQQMREVGAVARIMLVGAAASLWNVDPKSCRAADGVVHHDETGRSSTYGDLAEAAATQPVPTQVPLKAPADFKLIGTSPRRLDTPSKANGTAIFGIDVKVPGMKIGTVAASPVKGGRLTVIDEAAARRVPGVRDVVRLHDAVAVIGDHMWAAKQGLLAANPQWDDGPNGTLSMEGVLASLDAASRQDGVIARKEGDAHAALASSAKRIDAVYQLPFLSHAPMEPINTTLHVRPDGAEAWVGTQVPVRAQMAIAKETGLSPEKVVVHNQLMGGAFGRRLDIDSVVQAAQIAKQVAYPVKLIWTREEDIQHDFFRPYYYDRVSAGLDAQGNITGWTHRVTGSSVVARWAPKGMKMDGRLDPDAVEGAAEPPYDLANIQVEYVRSETNALTTLWWRGVGPTHNVFVVEGMIDELASAAKRDPVEFRRSMLQKNPRALAVVDRVAKESNWGAPLPHGVGRGIALQFAFKTYVATVIEAEVVNGEIKVRRVDMAVDCGPVVNPDTIVAQMQGGMVFGLSMALYSEITVTNGRVDQSNFNDYRILRMNEAPKIAGHIVHNPTAPVGGIGETATVAAAPALANAIFAASGRRLRQIPFAKGVASA